ncbi:unnamed protein product [Peniophora sp. CBMAI 1063]|nr:unnamed protein product [Peniophora sp. CBMAI 1063]
MWLPWGSSSSPSNKPPPKPEPPTKNVPPLPVWNEWMRSLPSEPSEYPAYMVERLRSLPPEALVVVFAAGGASALGTAALYRRYLWRIPTAGWVTPDMLKSQRRWVKGYVTTVGDADGFRLYHTPSIGWRWPLKFRHVPSLKRKNDAMDDKTLVIRLAAADAPERTQEGYNEAKEWLTERVGGRFVYCQLFSRDRYERLIADVRVPHRFLPGMLFKGPSVSVDMIRDGWAVVYEQKGAQYGKYGLDYFKVLEGEAIAARRGIWTNGTLAESPADFKKRVKERKKAKMEDIEEGFEMPVQGGSAGRGIVRRLLGW